MKRLAMIAALALVLGTPYALHREEPALCETDSDCAFFCPPPADDS